MAVQDIIRNKESYLEPKLVKKLNLDLLSRIVKRLESFQDEETHQYIDVLIKYINEVEDMSDFINIKKDYLKNIRDLTSHLKAQYDLSPKGTISSQYIGVGIALGSAVGVALGQTTPAFYGIGISLGLVFGSSYGNRKEKEAFDAGKIY